MSDPEAPRPADATEPAPSAPVEPAAVHTPATTEPAALLTLMTAADAPVVPAPDVAPPPSVEPEPGPGERPTFLFFGLVAAVSLILDVGSKAWAEIVLSKRPFDSPSLVLIPDHLTFTIAYNKGGAWGLLQDAAESVRRPFFFAVSVLAVLFIVSLYSKLGRGQRALTWGLPLVLGGALGNLSDRVTRSSVIDFIDYRAEWVLTMNTWVSRLVPRWGLTDHWPTFNVADIAICIGVGLMAVDMFTSRRGPERRSEPITPVLGA
jgi:signal peptidase II